MSEISFAELRPLVRFSDRMLYEDGRSLNNAYARDARLIYVFEGTLDLWMGDEFHKGTRGSLFLFPAGVRYTIANTSGQNARIMAMNFDFHAKKGASTVPMPWFPARLWDASLLPAQPVISDVPEFNAPLYLESMQMLEPLFAEMIAEQQNLRIYRNEMRNTLMYTVLLRIHRRLLSGEEPKRRSLVDEVIRYIQNNPAADLSNEALGKRFSYHPNYINRILQKRTGQSLHKYVLSCRISHALELLQTTNLSVTEVAERVGFSSIKHFSHSFKSIYGAPPTHFRE